MRKLFFAAAVLCLAGIAGIAQEKASFSGTWTLDVAKSKLGDRNTIESQTLTITQSATELKVDTVTKRTAPPAGGAGAGGGRMGGGGGDGTATYALDGKEVKSEMQNPMGAMTVTTKAKLEGSKLTITRTIATPMGDRTTSETWSLGADGKTLTIESQRPNRDGGMDTTTRVFNKS